MPYVFTEHGAVMVAAVLNTSFAVEASIQIARAFVRLRFILSQHEELSDKLAVLEKKWATHDDQISSLFEAIRALMEIPSTDKKTIGYEVSR